MQVIYQTSKLKQSFTRVSQTGTIQIIFDEANVHSDDHILLIIDDIEEKKYIICIMATSALKACYAAHNKDLSKREKTCLRRYENTIDDILKSIG